LYIEVVSDDTVCLIKPQNEVEFHMNFFFLSGDW